MDEGLLIQGNKISLTIYAYHDESRANKDVWWCIVSLMEDYDENRRRTVLASNMKTMDETMSRDCLQTTPTGTLPHLSFITCKPCLLGTEFKTVTNCKAGIMLHLLLCQSRK